MSHEANEATSDNVGWCLVILGRFWDDFGTILGPFWEYFGTHLGTIWGPFGDIWGPFWGIEVIVQGHMVSMLDGIVLIGVFKIVVGTGFMKGLMVSMLDGMWGRVFFRALWSLCWMLLWCIQIVVGNGFTQ